MKVGLNNLSTDEIFEAEDALDKFSFERYCCNCDNFPGDDMYKKRDYYSTCPFKHKFESGELNGDTEWKRIGCTKFWD